MWEYPSNLDSITFRLNDRPFRWESGLSGFRVGSVGEAETDLHFAGASYGTRDALIYYDNLVEAGLLDNEYNEIFPRTGRRWKDVIVLDLSEDKLEYSNALHVATKFNTANSPSGKMIVCITVSEETIVDSNGRWSIHRGAL